MLADDDAPAADKVRPPIGTTTMTTTTNGGCDVHQQAETPADSSSGAARTTLPSNDEGRPKSQGIRPQVLGPI